MKLTLNFFSKISPTPNRESKTLRKERIIFEYITPNRALTYRLIFKRKLALVL